jgi:hypothetical protein
MREATHEVVDQAIEARRQPCNTCGRPEGEHNVGELMICDHKANPSKHAKKPLRLCNVCTPLT